MAQAFGPGTILLGKYRVESVLGRGGMGMVLRVTHLNLDEELAIKVLMSDGATEADLTGRFLREAQAAARLRGEHVTRVVDIGLLPEGLPYMVMEYLRGTDLSRELARRSLLPVGEAVDYALHACEALAEAHANGIVHRDIKPGNLFLTTRPDGTPLLKILDFGISKAAVAASPALTKTDMVMGTVGYMSPEQMKAAKDVDARTDVWALGIVLYECLTGRRPFVGESFSAVVLMAGTEPPPPMDPKIPRALQSVVLRCLEKDRRARFPSIAALAAALAPFARDQRGATIVVDRTKAMLPRQADVVALAPAAGAPPTVVTVAGEPQPMTGSGARTGRYVVGGGAAVVAVCVIAAIVASRPSGTGAGSPGPAPGSQVADIHPSPPSPVVTGSAIDAAAAAPVAGSDAGPAPMSSTIAACIEIKVQKKWQELHDCAIALASSDRVKAAELSETAAQETRNEQADFNIRQQIHNGALRGAQAELKRMSPESVYFKSLSDTLEKADTASVEAVRAKADAYVAEHNCAALKHLASQQNGPSGTERSVAVVNAAVSQCNAKVAANGVRPSSPANPGTVGNAAGSGPGKGSNSPTVSAQSRFCELNSVEDLLQQASNQFNSGYASSALLIMTKALGCRQDVKMYRLAALYACAAHEQASARLYFEKVPSQFQSGILQKCQLEHVDLGIRGEE